MSIATGLHSSKFSSNEARRHLWNLGAVIESAAPAPAASKVAVAPHHRQFDPTALVAADSLQVEVRFTWNRVGVVILDKSGFPVFPALPDDPGLYRFDFGIDASGQRIHYIGESKNLRRRAQQYQRSKVDRKKALTSRRLHRQMVDHLSSGGEIVMFIVTDAELAGGMPLGLGRKSARLLAESAAVVAAQLDTRLMLLNIDEELAPTSIG
jgi:hypothetical protein